MIVSISPPLSLPMTPRVRSVGGMLLLTLLASLSACSPASKSPGIDMGAPEKSWKAKNRDEKAAYMAAVVQPAMREIFVEYDKKGFAEFDCQTCHGKNMDRVDFHMPNGLYGLPKVKPIEEARDYDEEVTEFMVKKVTPLLKDLLNRGEGPREEVNCHSCHEVE